MLQGREVQGGKEEEEEETTDRITGKTHQCVINICYHNGGQAEVNTPASPNPAESLLHEMEGEKMAP